MIAALTRLHSIAGWLWWIQLEIHFSMHSTCQFKPHILHGKSNFKRLHAVS